MLWGSWHNYVMYSFWKIQIPTVQTLQVYKSLLKSRINCLQFQTINSIHHSFMVVFDSLLNPLSSNIHIQILQTDLYTFPLRIS